MSFTVATSKSRTRPLPVSRSGRASVPPEGEGPSVPSLPARYLHEFEGGNQNMHRLDLLRLGLGTLVGFLVFWVAPVSAQSSAPLERNWMVSIHAEVIDKGQPVEGLTLEDFLVKDKGKVVEVVEVVEMDFEDCDSGPVERPYRRLLFLFEMDFSPPQFTVDALDLAGEMIASDRLACTEVLIATHEPGSGLRIEEELTANRESLLARLETMRKLVAGRVGSPTSPVGAIVPEDDLTGSRAGTLRSQKSVEQIEQERILWLVRSLARFTSIMQTVPGSSQVVVFSVGFDSSVVVGSQAAQLFDPDSSAGQAGTTAGGGLQAADATDGYHGAVVEKAFFEMLSDYDRLSVPIHAITIEEKGRNYHQAGRRVEDPSGLTLMTGRTGGELFRGTRSELAEETRALEPTGSIYLLTFKPRSLDSGRFRKLDVRLTNRTEGVKVLTPRGYFVP